MSRVEGERGSREAERAQKEQDKRVREDKSRATDREAFGRLVAKKQEGQTGAEQARAAVLQQPQSEAAKRAMLARGGVVQQSRVQEQARSFQGTLEQTQQSTQQHDAGRVAQREVGKGKDRVEHEDRHSEVVHKAEARRDADTEQARVAAQDAARPNAAIRGDGGGGGGGDDSPPRDDGSAAAAAALKKAAQPPAPTAQAQAAREVKQIPPELLEKLVSTVYLAVNDKGLKEFQIELKDGDLKGAFLKISADGGKVALKFQGLDPQTKALVESSKGELMRRLEKKGLSLSRLEV
jgi:hypothetical protein